jgi:feruloyl esterase
MNQSQGVRGQNGWSRQWAGRLVVCGLGMTVSIASAREDRCAGLKTLSLKHAEVVSATLVESHPFQKPSSVPASYRLPAATVPAHCEVHGIARPTSDSEIRFEVWLPSPAVWNGKYLQRGNGGWAGSIWFWALITPVARGYAVAATDDGHNTPTTMGARFAVGHPEKLIDFGFRAVHETAV